MPATNHVRSITYLMDCFIEEYRSGKLPEGITDLDLRAQVEVIKSKAPFDASKQLLIYATN